MKKILKVLLILIVTIACVFLGIMTRKNNAIDITSLPTVSGEGLSYMFKTSKNRIVMIDGGSEQDVENVVSVINDNGGIVEKWFITTANSNNFGVLKKVLEENLVPVNCIYISFNTADWYEKLETDEEYANIAEFFDLIYSEGIITRVFNISDKFEVLVDNLYFTLLNDKNPELNDQYALYNQSMVIHVSNTYKSMILMGNIAQDGAKEMRDNHQDIIKCDAVQVSNNGVQLVDETIYEEMNPKYIFIPSSKNSVNNKKLSDYINNKLKNVDNIIGSQKSMNLKIW